MSICVRTDLRMAYVLVSLASTTPKRVKDFVRRHVEAHFRDVHAMLRLSVRGDDGLSAGCNFAATTTLLNVVSGASTVLYKQVGSERTRFVGLLREFYPWELEGDGGMTANAVAHVLYDVFRNPLVHSLGVETKKAGSRDELRIEPVPSDGKAVGIGKGGHPEDLIEELDRATDRPYWAAQTIRLDGTTKTLLVEGLYFGIRLMLSRLSEDSECMARANAFLEVSENT